jgi:hypothetical protein
MLTQDERAEEAQRRQAPVRHAVRPPKENMFRGPSNRRCNNHVLTFEDGGTGGAQRASWRRYRQAAGAQRGRRGGGRREHLPAPAPEEQMQGVRGGEHLPAPAPKGPMQGVRGGEPLPAPAPEEHMQGVPSATHSGWEVKDEQLVMALGGALALAKAPAKRQKIVLTVSALLVPGDAGGAAASGTHPTIATTVGVPKSQLCTAAAAAPLLPRPLCRGPSAAAAPLPEGVSEQQRAELLFYNYRVTNLWLLLRQNSVLALVKKTIGRSAAPAVPSWIISSSPSRAQLCIRSCSTWS